MTRAETSPTEWEEDYELVADSLSGAVYNIVRHKLGVASASPAVEHFKQILYENLSNADFRLSEQIAETGFDKDHFRRRFKKETGKTPSRYLTDLCLTHAKQLLAEQYRFSIEAVANNFVFSDSLYFSTCFKKHVGMSPLAYRKSLLAQSEKP